MKNIKKIISKKQIELRLSSLSKEINDFYNGEEICVICILKGAVIFTCDLIKKLNMPIILDFMIVSSYEDKTISSENIKIIKDININIENKNILIVDDIIDTGITLKNIGDLLNHRNPKSIQYCTLLNKPERRKKEVDVKFKGFDIPNEFVVGYGLDYNQKYRNLNYIGKFKI